MSSVTSAPAWTKAMQHSIAVLALAVFGFCYYQLWGAGILTDERDYLQAFSLVQQHHSPYEWHGYLYPPFFAETGAFLMNRFSSHTVLIGLRIFNIFGATLIVWISVVLLLEPLWLRIGAAAVLMVILPSLRDAIVMGNISAGTSGLIIAAFFLWPGKPIPAGLLMGLGFAVKPLASGFFPVLLFQRSSAVRQSRTAAAVATAVVLVSLLMFVSELPNLLARLQVLPGRVYEIGTLSLMRVFVDLGFPLSQYWITAFILGGVSWAVFIKKDLSQTTLLCLACASSLSVIPCVWDELLVLGIPATAATMKVAIDRLQQTRKAAREERQYALLLFLISCCVVLAYLHGYSWGMRGGFSRWMEGVLAAVPLLSLWAMVWLSLLDESKEIPVVAQQLHFDDRPC